MPFVVSHNDANHDLQSMHYDSLYWNNIYMYTHTIYAGHVDMVKTLENGQNAFVIW